MKAEDQRMEKEAGILMFELAATNKAKRVNTKMARAMFLHNMTIKNGKLWEVKSLVVGAGVYEVWMVESGERKRELL